MVHTTVVGTYPRIGETPEEQALRRGIARLDRGEIVEAELQAIERDTVREVLREQNEIGIDLVTDGQISWYDSQSHFAGKLTSVETNGLVRYFDTNTYYRQPVVHGAVAWKAPVLADDWKFAQANSKVPVKAVLTGPVTLASLALDKHYRSKKALALDLATAVGEEVESLVHAGASNVQIDEPILTRHPDDLTLVSEALERIRSHKGRSTLTLFTFFREIAPVRNCRSSAPPLRKWGWVPERPPDDQRRILPETGVPYARPHEGVEGRSLHGRLAGARGESDLRMDSIPGRNRDRHPRRRRAIPGRHGDVLRGEHRRDRDLRPRPVVRKPVLQEADHRRRAEATRSDQRGLVHVRPGPDEAAGQGHDHRTLHDDGLVVRRILRFAGGCLPRLRETAP